ncbi:MAG: lysostaphin resistance A-like protein [Blastocatellia bacterium]
MSSIITYCPNCGAAFDQSYGQSCPQCSVSSPPPAPPDQLWGAGTGLLVWFASVALIVGLPLFTGLGYLILKMLRTGQMPQSLESDFGLVLVSVISTFPAHLLTLLICWLVVTGRGRRPFWQTLGWGWHPQFKWVHAVGLAFLMMGVAVLSEKFLPHRETDLEKLLKLGLSVRIAVAALAVLTAPLVEEVIYRGVLYAGIERDWGRAAGITAVTFLFALVHVPQYWGSYAAITAIVSLSLVLTLLRAWTGKLLPCVATHLVYNGVQAVALLVAPDSALDKNQTQSAFVVVLQSLGLS